MHNLETSGSEVAFALRGAPAWHGLANATWDEDETVTTSQMIDGALLSGWNVRLESVEDAFPGYEFVTSPYLVIRDNPFTPGQVDVLSTVGERYTVVQNEDVFEFGDAILDGGASWEAAGSIRNGRTVFGSLVIPHNFTLDGEGIADEVRSYLLVHTSHDGTTAVQASVTPVRVVCQNTFTMALRGVKQSYKVRHTQTVGARVQVAREALGLAFEYVDAFEEEAKALFAQSVTDAQFDKIVQAIYPKPDETSKAALTRWNTKNDLIHDIYYTSPTQVGITGTAWGAYNALTERLDWFRNGRGAEGRANVLAAASGFDPITNAEKGKILAVVKELATV